MVLERPLVVLADLHVSVQRPSSAPRALAQVLARHPEAELVLAGDTFDLTIDACSLDAGRTVFAALRTVPAFTAALRDRLLRGVPATLIVGNHDAALVRPQMRRSLLSALELSSEAPLFVCPWFVRRGRFHIEHGHVYDPDNAPLHPLAPWSPLTEPLGVALTRRFLVPCGALSLVHAHETTPLAGLARVMRLFGHRGALVVARYFGVAAALCWQSLGQRGGSDPLQNELAVETFARDADVDLDCVRALLRSLPAATHRRFIRTFRRLYLDRACATAAALGAVAVSVTTGGAAPVAGALVAAGYLGASCLGEGTSRYAGRLEVRLRTAARSIGLITGSKLVILGHSHHGDSAPGYANPGSFGYPDASVPRYILVDIDGNASCLEALTRCTRFALTPSR